MGGIGRINWAHHLSELGQTPQSLVTEKLLIISSFTYYPVVTALGYEKMAFKFFRKGKKTYKTNIEMPNKSKFGKRWLSLGRNIQFDSKNSFWRDILSVVNIISMILEKQEKEGIFKLIYLLSSLIWMCSL